jgi:hypothetical protein
MEDDWWWIRFFVTEGGVDPDFDDVFWSSTLGDFWL